MPLLILNLILTVHRYVICNQEGLVLRRAPSMSQEVAVKYAQHLNAVVSKARHVTRDLNPNDDLKNVRIRTRTRELIISNCDDTIIAVVQQWKPYSNN